MSRQIALGYGRHPYQLAVPDSARVVEPPTCPPPPPLSETLGAALDQPIEAAQLESFRLRDVTIIVSDRTRSDPRDAMVRALLSRLPARARLTVAIANGTHAPGDPAELLAPDLLARACVVNHDGRSDSAVDLVEVGRTRRGTRVRLNRCLLHTDLVIATGSIRPHYFAGYGAGVKSIFPGLGCAPDIRANHILKSDPLSRAGIAQGNPCRDDLEDAARLLPTPTFLLNAIADPAGAVQGAVAGDIVAAFRAGARRCDALSRVSAPRSHVVVVSGTGPVTASLYQASKLAALAAPLVYPGGQLLLAAECLEGIGPIDIVNKGIYEIGIRPRLAEGVSIALLSALPKEVVAHSYCQPLADPTELLFREGVTPTILPQAEGLIIEEREP